MKCANFILNGFVFCLSKSVDDVISRKQSSHSHSVSEVFKRRLFVQQDFLGLEESTKKSITSAALIQGCLVQRCLHFFQIIKHSKSDSVRSANMDNKSAPDRTVSQFYWYRYFFVTGTLKKKKNNNKSFFFHLSCQLDDIIVGWHCNIRDIPALTFYSGSKQSYVIFFSRCMTTLCNMLRHYIKCKLISTIYSV